MAKLIHIKVLQTRDCPHNLGDGHCVIDPEIICNESSPIPEDCSLPDAPAENAEPVQNKANKAFKNDPPQFEVCCAPRKPCNFRTEDGIHIGRTVCSRSRANWL